MENLNPLKAEKPEKAFPFSVQICLRCGNRPAVKGEIFCEKCIKERKEFDELTRLEKEETKHYEFLEDAKDEDD